MESWLNCGNMLLFMGLQQEALVHFERALAIDPDSQEGWHLRGVVLSELRRYDEAVASFDRALEINFRAQGSLYDRARILPSKFLALVRHGQLELARKPWHEAVAASEEIDLGWIWVLVALEVTVRLGYLSFARGLIEGTGIETPLFPYARALEYLLNGDRGLIEKLSPEVRRIVEEIVTRLQSGDLRGERKSEPGQRMNPVGRRRQRHL
jgi:tetratricopeptide (TPR) repeat protein